MVVDGLAVELSADVAQLVEELEQLRALDEEAYDRVIARCREYHAEALAEIEPTVVRVTHRTVLTP